MTAFYGQTFVTQHENSTEQIQGLQHAIQENTSKLEEVQQKRLRVEGEIIQCIAYTLLKECSLCLNRNVQTQQVKSQDEFQVFKLDLSLSTRELERRVDLMMEKSEVVDVLQQLGHLLQEERHFSEQLNDQAPADRNKRKDLVERSERITNKTRTLTAELLQVKQCLVEAKARNMAAQALIHAPTSKSKRNQRK